MTKNFYANTPEVIHRALQTPHKKASIMRRCSVHSFAQSLKPRAT